MLDRHATPSFDLCSAGMKPRTLPVLSKHPTNGAIIPAPSRVILGSLISVEQTAARLFYGYVMAIGFNLLPYRLSDLQVQSAHSPTTPQDGYSPIGVRFLLK